MPSFKLSGVKAQEVKSGFEPYDGPEPSRKGFYRGVIKSIKHGLNANSGSRGFAIVLELEAAKGDPKGHAMFDGFPMFSRSIITEAKDGGALKEGAMRNLQNLLAALGSKDEPNVVLAKGDEDKVEVLKIDGKNPVGIVVNVDVDFELYEGERRPQVGGIYKYKEIEGASAKGTYVADDEEEDDEADLMDADAAEEEAEDGEFEAREEELGAMALSALKKIAKELEIGISGTKAQIVERILDAEFAEEEEEADDEDDTPAVLADDADEAEDDEEEEDDEEDDEEEDDEADEEDDEAKAERIEELGNIARAGLKSILKEVAPDYTVLKRHSEADLREAIIAVEFADDLPF